MTAETIGELVSPFFDTIQMYTMSFLHVFGTGRVMIFEKVLVLYHLGLYTLREPWYLGKIILVSMWY